MGAHKLRRFQDIVLRQIFELEWAQPSEQFPKRFVFGSKFSKPFASLEKLSCRFLRTKLKLRFSINALRN